MRPVIVTFRKLFFLLLTLIIALPHLAWALTADQVYELVKDSVVVVMSTDRAGKTVGLGSGVVLPSGDIVTNHHVIKAGVKYTVGQRRKTVPAFLQGSNPDKDIALLLAPGLTATPARLGQASRLKVGDKVYAVGAPQGLELSLSEGIVSQLRGGRPPMIQTTVAISQGSSGGGLFNAEGELVGITTFYLKEGQGLNFALPVEWVSELVSSSKPGQFPKEFNPDDWEPVVPGTGEKSSKDWSDRVSALISEKDWEGLLAHGRQWTRTEPDNSTAWFTLGLAYKALGRNQDAIEAYRKAQSLADDSAGALRMLGDEYKILGRHREAIKAYREALRVEPDNAEAWQRLGNAYLKMDLPLKAIEALREALRLKPDDAVAWNNLGCAYGGLTRYGEAIEAFQESLRIEPDDAMSWGGLATAYANSGNRTAALKALKEMRRYDPQKADKVFNLIIKP